MDFNKPWTEIPVILLYNIDPSWLEQDIQECREVLGTLANSLNDVGHSIQQVELQSSELETALEPFNPGECLVFNWCEELPGIPRSEYQVAQILEHMGYTFTGSSSKTLALSQDKPRVKRLLQQFGISTPIWQVYSSTEHITWTRFPAIVKLAFEHCSYGISRDSVVQSMPELTQRVNYVVNELHQPALVEEFIDGREFHVGAVGNSTISVLPPAEIDYSPFADIHDRLCTYESNFDPTSQAYQLTRPKLPVVLSSDQRIRLEAMVIAAYRAIGCRDYARMDIRMRHGVFYLLDVNPNPDISSDTSLALGAGLVGLSYGKLGSLLINLAAQRHPTLSSFFQITDTGEERCLVL